MTLKTAARDIRFMNELFPASVRIAGELGDDEPGPEHLVLAAIELPDGLARAVLESTGVSSEAIREAIVAVHAEALAGLGVQAPPVAPSKGTRPGFFRASGTFDEVFQRVRAIAKKRELRSSDVIAAAAERDHGTIARVFETLRIDRPTLVAAALASKLEAK